MLSKNSYGSFDECPEYKAEHFFFRLPFLIAEVVERLLHRLAKSLLKGSRIKSEEFPIELIDDFQLIHDKQTILGIVSAAARWRRYAESVPVRPRVLRRP